MKKAILILFGLILLNVTASASILIYSMSLKEKLVGDGQTIQNTVTGWMVFDLTTNQVTEISVNKTKKTFKVLPLQVQINSVTGAKNAGYEVIYFSPSPGDSGMGAATGTISSLNVGTTTVNGAKVLSVNSSYFHPSDIIFLETIMGRDTFDAKDSTAQNQIDGNFGNTISRLSQSLLNSGYTQN